MIAHWLEWKQICSLEGCGTEATSALHRFAGSRFTGNLRRYARMTNQQNAFAAGLSERDTWHLLETHLTVRNNRAGKRYKDWLFTRAAGSGSDPLAAVESGASLLMRDVTREFLRNEHSPAGTIAFDETWSSSLTIEAMLPGEMDPAEKTALHEYEALASEHAADLLAKADRREKAALMARELGLAFSSHTVTEQAGCKHTALYKAYHAFVEKAGRLLRNKYPDDDNEARIRLALMTVNAAKKLAAEEIFAERTANETLVSREGEP